MPAEPPARVVLLGVVAVAGVVGQVDPADERQLAVDHDRLLVVAVERVLARVAVGLDPGVARRGSRAPRRPRCGWGERPGSGAPDHTSTRTSIRSASSASSTPIGVRGGRSRRARTTGARCQPVMWTKLLGLAPARAAIAGSALAPSIRTSSSQPSRGGGSPAANTPGRRGLEHALPAEPAQPAAVLERDRGLDPVADQRVEPVPPPRLSSVTRSPQSAAGYTSGTGRPGMIARPDGQLRPATRPAPARRRQARAGPGDHAGRERRSRGLGAGPRGLPAHRPGRRDRLHRAARGGQVDAAGRADQARARARADGRGAVDRPLLAVHQGRAAGRPDPADRAFPGPRRVHTLDGQPRRARRVSARRRCRRRC